MTRIESFENKDNYFENKVKITRESQSTEFEVEITRKKSQQYENKITEITY